MHELSSLGNTIIVVEHDRDIISSSDWVVELGPGGGHLGGNVIFSGTTDEFLQSDTLTARYIKGRGSDALSAMRNESKRKVFHPLPITHHPSLMLYGAAGNNLKSINMRIPLHALTVVSGVSGSGKSSLVIETLHRALARHFRIESEIPLPYKGIEGIERIKGVRLIDQSPIGKTPRSNPLTYLKIFEPIRKLFAQQLEARAHGYTPGFFSFNIPGGRCETCKGEGYQRMEMYFFEDVFVKCEDCKGRRYKEDALRVKYKGKTISNILGMTVDEAFEFFYEVSEICSKLGLMKDMGLGYLVLGQSATTLSGGEAQRLKICAELLSSPSPRFSYGKRGVTNRGLLYILDEPTVGLHHNDVLMFMEIVRKLVDTGNTVVIIEHNFDVIARADWIIDLGPEGGEKGGTILFEGTPEELIYATNSYTGKYLREYY
jgi:excinuclease ABC subunit A